EHRQKLDAIRDVLVSRQPDVLFLQEPIDDLETTVRPSGANTGSINLMCFARLLSYSSGAAARAGTHHVFKQFSDSTAIFVSTAALREQELAEVDCSAHLGANNPLINGCTAVMVRRETHDPYVLLSVHTRSQAKQDQTLDALQK